MVGAGNGKSKTPGEIALCTTVSTRLYLMRVNNNADVAAFSCFFFIKRRCCSVRARLS